MKYQLGMPLGGKLTYLGPAPKRPGGATRIKVRCICGTEFVCQQSNVRTGNTTQCKTCSVAARGNKQVRVWTHERQIYVRYRSAAKKRQLEFTLTQPELASMLSAPCHWCGVPSSANLTVNGRPFAYNGVDRLNNERGYHADNCVPCCLQCNRAKGALALHKWLDWLDRLFIQQKPRL